VVQKVKGCNVNFYNGRGFRFSKIPKLIPIPKKRTLRKKAIMMKNEDEKKKEDGYDER
jgi:hypothetical protein